MYYLVKTFQSIIYPFCFFFCFFKISATFYFREEDDGMVEAIEDYKGGNDSLLYAIQDYDKDRAVEAENKARKAGEKARRQAEECFRTSAENKEDDPEEQFMTASLLKEQKALEQ